MSPVTIADVARAAEVSTATVSNALNGTGRLADSTRARVRSVAAALGYGGAGGPAPRILGLAVTTYGTHRWNFAGVPYFAQAINAATVAAHARGYALTALPAAPEEASWRTVALAGVLLLDSPAGDPVVRILRERGLPLAFDGRPAEPRPGEAWVDNDHHATTRTVLDHLAAQGARRIALMAGPGGEHYTLSCLAAYREWCAEHRTEPCVVPLTPGDDEGRALDPLLSGERRPDALYGIYNPCGRRALAAAARRSLSVPADLLLVCASEDPAYATTTPPVSTVSLVPDAAMAAAVTALVGLIEGPGHTPPPVIVPARLLVRASSVRTASRADTASRTGR
ncbi:LacI family DNA-binding transcriptional regulator [Streptomyces sp. NPDC057137]|uniref:LacI family DNA-binding transcriptional regulator n=1 Tax=Streptomyces sp. NPDC057137 TaxID=3346030 RepID=UPI00362F6413